MSKQKPEYDDEEEFDPRKLFDEKEFNTLYVNKEGFSQKPVQDELVTRLLEPGITRTEQETIFAELKKRGATEPLVEAIASASDEHKRILLAACWETGLDFSAHFRFMANLVMDGTFEVALEAFTVIQEMENEPSTADLNGVLKQLRTQREHKNAMVAELLSYLEKK